MPKLTLENQKTWLLELQKEFKWKYREVKERDIFRELPAVVWTWSKGRQDRKWREMVAGVGLNVLGIGQSVLSLEKNGK